MYRLYDQGTGEPLGLITEEQLQFLIDQLEEESLEDKDYTITPITLDYLAAEGADSDLLTILQEALGNKDQAVVEWRAA